MTRVALHVGQLGQPVPGGIGTYVRALLSTLPETGIDLEAFGACPTPSDTGVPYTELGFPRGSLRYEAWQRVRRPRLDIRADVVHGPSLAIPPRRIRGGDAALVVTVHDVAFLRYPHFFTRRGVAFHTRALEIARAEADIIITPSAFTREELGREGFDTARVVAIPHGIDVPVPPGPDLVAARLRALGVDSPFVLGVGTIEPRKGFEIIAGVADKLAAAGLVFVLAGPDGWNEVPGLDRAGVVRLGAVSSADLDVLYRSALACVVPSHYEGFGLPALEAMARGCIAITSTAESLTEVVAEAGIHLSADDPAAWSDAILALAGDPDRQDELRQAALARATAFRWSTAAEAHADAYRRSLIHATERTS